MLNIQLYIKFHKCILYQTYFFFFLDYRKSTQILFGILIMFLNMKEQKIEK